MKAKIAMSHFYAPLPEAVAAYKQHNELLHFANSDDVLKSQSELELINPRLLPDNIEHLNAKLNEITSAYALLHNFDDEETEYMGLCHYRRFFAVKTVEKFMASGADVLAAQPAGLGFIGWTQGLEAQYKAAHSPEDFELFKTALRKTSWHDEAMFQNWLKATQLPVPCNLVVMKKSMFKQLLNDLLEVMLPLCDMIDVSKRDNYQKRACSFLAERFTSWWTCLHVVKDKLQLCMADCEFHPEWKPTTAKDQRGNFT